jgi:hypothetical protein
MLSAKVNNRATMMKISVSRCSRDEENLGALAYAIHLEVR